MSNESQTQLVVTADLLGQFAKMIAQEQVNAKRQENNKAVAYVPTQIKPTKVSVETGTLFTNIDVPAAPGAKIQIDTWKIQPEGIPTVIENYHFRKEMLNDLLNWLVLPSDYGFWMVGLHGTGKTSFVEQVAARLGRQVWSDTGSQTTEFIDLFGYSCPTKNGEIKFVEGGLLKAMKEGGIYIINEVDAMSPSELIKLNELTAHKPIYVPQLESWVHPKPNFRIVCTSNTNGTGDDTRYIGTQAMNTAFKDRWMMVNVPYLPAAIERQFLESIVGKLYNENTPNFNKNRLASYNALVGGMVEIANMIRDAAQTMGGESTPPSIRALMRWIDLVLKGSYTDGMSELRSAFLKAYGNALSDAERQTAIEICTDVLGDRF
ncbi:AAA family ATPase [Photobacterium leiognathi]|uniref:AAA family ATPase n=1 Tax=Photobacterium leiognathi TaxID=553611 RepID=UPI002738B7C0|nr:AAA family ATPase [Photobacterium leiognathi]